MLKNLFILLLLLPFLVCSQTDSLRQKKLDSLYVKLAADSAYIYRFREWRPYLHYHERHSIDNKLVSNFYGPEIGVAINEKHIVGLGFYFSGKATRQPFETFDNNVKVKQNINVNFGSVFYKYILSNHRFYEIHLPVELGTGNFYSNFTDSAGTSYRSSNSNIILGSASFFCILKPLRWIGISGSLGYRFTNEEYFTGLYYTLGIWIGVRNLQSDFRYHVIKKRKYREDVTELGKN